MEGYLLGESLGAEGGSEKGSSNVRLDENAGDLVVSEKDSGSIRPGWSRDVDTTYKEEVERFNNTALLAVGTESVGTAVGKAKHM